MPTAHIPKIMVVVGMNRKHFLSLIIACYIGVIDVAAQNVTKHTVRVNGEKCTYYTVGPKNAIEGIVLLLPGRGENPGKVSSNTRLPNVLASKGFLIVMPVLLHSLFASSSIRTEIEHVLGAELTKIDSSKVNLFIGGFSAGGSVALSYAESLLSSGTKANLKGIFIIDAPLDLERFYHSALRLLNYNCGTLIKKEGSFTKNYLDQTLGGAPAPNRESYLNTSPYSASSPDGGNAKWLKDIAIRLYSEPDLQFVRNKYCSEFQIEDINSFDLESLSVFLVKIGNEKSEYIKTVGRGFHSWNIADPDGLAEWLMNLN